MSQGSRQRIKGSNSASAAYHVVSKLPPTNVSLRLLRVDKAIQISAIKLDQLSDFQRGDCPRPLQLSNCVNRSC